jgi:hypothetical protein
MSTSSIWLQQQQQAGTDRASMIKNKAPGSKVGLQDWGYPGFLTEEEFAIFVSFNVSLN